MSQKVAVGGPTVIRLCYRKVSLLVLQIDIWLYIHIQRCNCYVTVLLSDFGEI